jgi:heme-degrading monooxygenase HmoA
MIAIVWEFVVKDEAMAAFERAYGPDGDWAALFRRHPGYRGTSLLRDTQAPARFLTIDRWDDAATFERMQAAAREEYARLDARFAEMTLSERRLGVFVASFGGAGADGGRHEEDHRR